MWGISESILCCFLLMEWCSCTLHLLLTQYVPSLYAIKMHLEAVSASCFALYLLHICPVSVREINIMGFQTNELGTLCDCLATSYLVTNDVSWDGYISGNMRGYHLQIALLPLIWCNWAGFVYVNHVWQFLPLSGVEWNLWALLGQHLLLCRSEVINP